VLAALQQRLAGHSIVACRVPSGQSGEPGAICLDEEGTDLGRYLVIQGYALADIGQSYDYLPAEGAARTAKRGLWRYR
jgi:endonuclease YncB( thermonuclease family)